MTVLRYWKLLHFAKRFANYETAFKVLPEYGLENKLKIEERWHKPNCSIEMEENKEKMYILSMFPYPSGQLHMGHMRVYTVADALVRYFMLKNKNVIFPMGWDSFGLPAENAAIERQLHPKEWTKKNISDMKTQMVNQMTLNIDWTREISTCDANYYKWTQWIFCQLVRKGYAYLRSDKVNWDPIDCTVLADELIDNDGKSWRSGAKVEKKILQQWWLRTTAFTKDLIDGLNYLLRFGGQWRNVINKQIGWLGNPDYVQIDLDLIDLRKTENRVIERLGVYTDMPGIILAGLAAFVEINTENVWWDDKLLKSDEHEVLHPYLAVIHPMSGRLMPIILNKNMNHTRDNQISSRFGLPAINIEDSRTASKYELKTSARLGYYDKLLDSCWPNVIGQKVNWDKTWMWNESTAMLRKAGRGGYPCSYLRKDWLISRQRNWGTPIPVLHCSLCGTITCATDEQLPVLLVEERSQTHEKGEKCRKCGNTNPETLQWDNDTLDTFMDSSWYYLRYLDPHGTELPCQTEKARNLMPVDIYVGGEEHAIRHLFYARFINHFLCKYTDIYGVSDDKEKYKEPFQQFLPIGLVLSETFETSNGEFVKPDQIEFRDENNKKVAINSKTGEPLNMSWQKMSKSKYNGVSPQSVVEKFGIDTARIILLSNTGPDKDRKWTDKGDIVTGTLRWESRLWELIRQNAASNTTLISNNHDILLENEEFIVQYTKAIKESLRFYEKHFTISSSIARMHKLTKFLKSLQPIDSMSSSIAYNRAILDMLVLIYPVCPLLSSELWGHISQRLVSFNQVFIDTSSKYEDVFGEWKYDLNQPIWKQSIVTLHEKFFDKKSHLMSKQKQKISS